MPRHAVSLCLDRRGSDMENSTKRAVCFGNFFFSAEGDAVSTGK